MKKPELREHIEKMLYKSRYVVNESPIYRAVMDGASFDGIPEGWNMKEAEGAQPSGSTQSSTTPDPAATPVGTAAPTPPTPDPAAAPQGTAAPAASTPSPSPSPAPTTPPMAAAVPAQPQPDLNKAKEDLQKQVMEYQLQAMRGMSQKIEQLEGLVGNLNSQLSQFSKEVEKVREPTDVEKFDGRKQDSHPYYYNLNDLWNNNTFQGRMDTMNTKGIVKTEGGYMADFDQLPKMTDYEVKNSFDKI